MGSPISPSQPSGGQWAVKSGRSPYGYLAQGVHLGAAGDLPIAGDFNGDGVADFAVSSGGQWAVKSGKAPYDFLAQGVHLGRASDVFVSGSVDRPPVANAGTDVAVASKATFTLDASGSLDPKGSALTYQWVQIDGPAAFIEDNRSARTGVAGVAGPATLRFRVTVADGNGRTATDDVTVTVRAPK